MAKAAKSKIVKKGSKSSTSVETDEQKQQAAILELGRKLIKDLDSRDLTAKWISTYLSELMVAAETDPTRKTECKDLILELWRERCSIPGDDPLLRYSETLAAMEAFLKTGQPLFEVWLPGNNQESREKNWAVLTRKLRTHADFLTSTAVIQASKADDLLKDELLDIAHLADPDNQSHVLDTLRVLIQGQEAGKNADKESDHTLETIAKLRETLDDFEALYLANRTPPKTVNLDEH